MFLQRARSRCCCPPTTSWRSCAPAGLLKTTRRSGGRARHSARLPAGLRPLRQRSSRPRRRRRVAGAPACRGHRRSPATSPQILRALADTRRRSGRPRGLDRRAARGRVEQVVRRTRCCCRLCDAPDQADPHLRRAGQAPGAGRGGDLRRRRLRLVRRQVRRGLRTRLLARHRAVRLPRQRTGLRDRGPGRPSIEPDRQCCSGTALPASA